MSAELILSASAFTHKGQLYDANTSNFILDGRYLFGYELDNSQVSINSKDKNYFFAICDSKPNEYLDTSVSGIKELKKLSGKLKSSSNDIKTKTDMMAECFMGTENLLYGSMSWSEEAPERAEPKKPLSAVDNKPSSYPDNRMGARDPGRDDSDADIDDETDNFSEYDYINKSEPEVDDAYDDEIDEDYPYRDDEEYDEREYDDYDDGYGYAGDGEEKLLDEEEIAPGGKGFSSAGIILSEKKVSVLAQGDCEAFLLRGASLRILSSEGQVIGGEATGQRYSNMSGRERFNTAPQPSYGRPPELFDPKVGDVLLLCSRTVVDALGKENIDDYLALQEEASIISSAIIHDAINSDPDENLTCLVVKVDDINEEDMLQSLQRRVDTRFTQNIRNGRQTNTNSNVSMNSGMHSGMNVSMNTGMNRGVNVGMDTGMNRSVNAGMDTGMNRGMNTGVNRGMNYGVNSGMNTGVNHGVGSMMGSGGAAGAAMNSSVNPNVGFNNDNTRIARTSFQNRDAFSRTGASKFEVPSKKFGTKGINRSVIQSIVTTVILIVLLLVSYYMFEQNREETQNAASSGSSTSSPKSTQTPKNDGASEPSTREVDDEEPSENSSRTPTFTTEDEENFTTTTTAPAPTPTPGPLAEHKVVSGEILGRISTKYYGSSRKEYVDLIKQENGLTSDVIHVGDTLVIPRVPESMTSTSN